MIKEEFAYRNRGIILFLINKINYCISLTFPFSWDSVFGDDNLFKEVYL